MLEVLLAAALASRHSVVRPADVQLAAFYADGANHATPPKHTWANARQPAVDAVNLLGAYLAFDDGELPPVFYVPALEDEIVGFYAYNGATSINITLLDSLNAETEFYVALHELIHWAGFGNLTAARTRKAS